MFGSFYYESKEIFNTLYLRIISCLSVTIKILIVQTGSLMTSSKADRQIWQCFFALPPNSQLWNFHMVAYHCSRLRKSTLGQK